MMKGGSVITDLYRYLSSTSILKIAIARTRRWIENICFIGSDSSQSPFKFCRTRENERNLTTIAEISKRIAYVLKRTPESIRQKIKSGQFLRIPNLPNPQP